MSQQSTKREITIEGTLLGALAACVSKSTKAPFERVKLLLQCQNEIFKQGRLTENYTGIINCTKRTLQTEGAASLWRGNLVSCLSYIPRQAVVLLLNDNIKNLFKVDKTESYAINFAKLVASGSISGAVGLVVLYPFDYVRTRLACDVKQAASGGYRFKSMTDVVTQTYSKAGVRGLYRGFLVSVSGVVVYRGCYFGLYDSLRPIVLGATPHITASFTFGYLVVFTSGLVAYPLDTIRRRLMVASMEEARYKHAFDCVATIVRNEGVRVLFKGFGVNFLTSIYGTLILVGFNSYIQPYLRMRGVKTTLDDS